MSKHNDLWKPPSDLVSKVYDCKKGRAKKKSKGKDSKKDVRSWFLKYFRLHEMTSNAVICDKISKQIPRPMPGNKSAYYSYMKKAKRIIGQTRKPKPTVKQYTGQFKTSKEFYASQAWRELRYIALKNSDGCCNLCGARASDGVKLHVDHIKPRSKYPKLELDLDNLQILCEDCNMGKSNHDDTNWKQHWETL